MMKEQLGRSSGVNRISMLILLGQLKQAMLAAQEMKNNKDTTRQGILQVCRVFKAADLNLQRANTYIQFLKTGKDVDPVQTFLQAPVPSPAAAPATGVP